MNDFFASNFFVSVGGSQTSTSARSRRRAGQGSAGTTTEATRANAGRVMNCRRI